MCVCPMLRIGPRAFHRLGQYSTTNYIPNSALLRRQAPRGTWVGYTQSLWLLGKTYPRNLQQVLVLGQVPRYFSLQIPREQMVIQLEESSLLRTNPCQENSRFCCCCCFSSLLKYRMLKAEMKHKGLTSSPDSFPSSISRNRIPPNSEGYFTF